MNAITQILSNIPKGFMSGLTLNLLIIVPVYYLFWKKYKAKLQHLRIQVKERVNNEQIKRELKNAVFTLLIGATFSSVVIYLSTQGYTRIYTNVNDYSVGYSILSFFILLIIDDTWFYWTHRLLHHPKLFNHIHFEHHKSVDVNPFTSLSFHVGEALLLTLWIVPVSFVLPIHSPVLGILQLWGFLDNLKSHLGYEIFPSWWNKSIGRLLTSSTYHNMHHSKFKGNYGVHFRLWDRLLNTEFNDYETKFDKIQTRKARTAN